MSSPKYAGGERLDGAGEVREGDVLVDDEPLDLVELDEVARVGRVAPVDAARHDDVQRERVVADRRLHEAHLDRRGVGAQHDGLRGAPRPRRSCRASSRAGWPGGMLRASKLYQSVSTSGPSATREPHGDEHVLELVARPRDEVPVAALDAERRRRGPRARRARGGPARAARGWPPRPARRAAARTASSTERVASWSSAAEGAALGLVEAAELAVPRPEHRAAPAQPGVERLERVEVGGAGRRCATAASTCAVTAAASKVGVMCARW